MLILSSSELLGDKRINEVEALARFKEQNNRLKEAYKLPDQVTLTDAMERMGRPMTHTDMVNKLLRMNPNMWVEDSINHSGFANFYTMHDDKKVCLHAAYKKGWLPEFTVIHENEDGAPAGRTMGWREVLARLLKRKMITFTQIRQGFGDNMSYTADRWLKETRYMR